MSNNQQIELAWKFIEQTDANIFLTGKAGTGKTTFLRNLKQNSPKRMIVVAPTGVAAINAGGVTIHSFFQLPFGPYLPSTQQTVNEQFKTKFGKEKVNIIKSLDLLVIDEISMVRADLLDAINDVLKRYRDRNRPFGGVQLLMIGDLQQLAPVVKPTEWELIRGCYNSPFFFDSKALLSTEYLTIELKHIYRQNDNEFIEILNRVRENNIDFTTLEKLNSRYIEEFNTQDAQGYITLTSHNETARRINDSKLQQLKVQSYTFKCKIEGNFPEYLYPTDSDLELKKGAQVMFIKNDISGAQRYFNGKIGEISHIGKETIEVKVDDSTLPIKVEIAEWTNTKYTIDSQTKEIREEVDGTFRQMPLKAAWAITIHKSQGLTFDKAIIDAAGSFSHGQVYVALSRCRSFSGLILRTPLSAGSIINDEKVKEFNNNFQLKQPGEERFKTLNRSYYESLLIDMFNFSLLRIRIFGVQKIFNEQLKKLYPKLSTQWNELLPAFENEILTVSQKFQTQVKNIISSTPELENNATLTDRITKGQSYFLEKCKELIQPLTEQSNIPLDNKEIKKSLTEALKKINDVFNIKIAILGNDNSSGFSIQRHLQAKSKAALDIQSPKKNRTTTKETTNIDDSQDIKNPGLFETIRLWRKETAEENNVPAYVIMHQKTLVSVCNLLPNTKTDLLKIKGIGKKFISKYGDQILNIIEEYNKKRAV